MKSQTAKRKLVIVAMACVALLAADRFALGPAADGWKARSERIAVLRQSLDRGEFLLDRAESLDRQWARLRDQALPEDAPSAENRMLRAVNSWAANAGLTVSGIRPRWIEDAATGPRMEIRLSGAGDLEVVCRFLNAVETGAMPLRVEDVEIRSRDDNGRDITLDVRVTGLTFPGKKEESS